MAALSGDTRTATIVSQGRSTVKRFPGDKLEEIIEKYPEITGHLIKTLSGRLKHSNQIILKLAGGPRRPPTPQPPPVKN